MRATLNKAFFAKLYVDGEKIAEHEMREPFDTLVGAYHDHVIARTEFLLDELATQNAGALTDPGAENRDSSADTNPLTLRVSGWSKTAMVGDTGIEPVTSSV